MLSVEQEATLRHAINVVVSEIMPGMPGMPLSSLRMKHIMLDLKLIGSDIVYNGDYDDFVEATMTEITTLPHVFPSIVVAEPIHGISRWMFREQD